jgi:hypothetical protein
LEHEEQRPISGQDFDAIKNALKASILQGRLPESCWAEHAEVMVRDMTGLSEVDPELILLLVRKVAPRKVDSRKIERADRESKLLLDAEREARKTKSSRLKSQRLAMQSGLQVSNK